MVADLRTVVGSGEPRREYGEEQKERMKCHVGKRESLCIRDSGYSVTVQRVRARTCVLDEAFARPIRGFFFLTHISRLKLKRLALRRSPFSIPLTTCDKDGKLEG